MPRYEIGSIQPVIDTALDSVREAEAVQRLWGRDGTLWTTSAAVAEEIEDRLGWLDLPVMISMEVGRLRALQAEIDAAGYRQVVLLGMGGSSLAAEVMGEILGFAPDSASLTILDTTDPTQVARVEASLTLAETLFIVASKSGTTSEAIALYEYFRERCRATLGDGEWCRHFVAITDPDTPLEQTARSEGFRALYLNPPDVGGRYSALSFFGLLPAALIGADVDLLLERARAMARACRAIRSEDENPALLLGAAMGSLAAQEAGRRDKLALITSPRLAPFGAWVEQLVAESTGKDGKGIVPVVNTRLHDPSRFSKDRLWVCLRLAEDHNEPLDAFCAALKDADEPLILIDLEDVHGLGDEFFRWEFATAIAGFLLGVNPFDQPNVEAAKEQTRRLIAQYEQAGALPEEQPSVQGAVLSLYTGKQAEDGVAGTLRRFWSQAASGDYGALLAYVERNEANLASLERLAELLESRVGIPMTIGFGPRYLHSTGQLHKGGPNTVLALEITQDDTHDLPIPGKSYTFGILKRAQALGDLCALREAGRRVMRVHIGPDVQAGISALTEETARALD